MLKTILLALPAGLLTFVGMIFIAGLIRTPVEMLPLAMRLRVAFTLLCICATVTALLLGAGRPTNGLATASLAGVTTALILLAIGQSFDAKTTYNPLTFGWPGVIGVLLCSMLGGWLGGLLHGVAGRPLLPAGIIAALLFIAGFAIVSALSQRAIQQIKNLPDTHDLAVRIAALAEEYVATRSNVRLMVGVLRQGQRYNQGFGQQQNRAITPNQQSLYEIGSVTKLFTAILLAQLVEEGRVALDDPISKFLPKQVALAPKVAAITLRQLATHTSGLPRLPTNAFTIAGFDETNLYRNYGVDDLYKALPSVMLESEPGKVFGYSNLGVGLLGHLLSLAAEQPYEELLKQKVIAPLGLIDTTITLTAAQQDRLISGHDAQGNVVANWEFDVLAPAGAIRSTAGDMLDFLAANLQPNKTVLSQALVTSHTLQSNAESGQPTGLGWLMTTTSTGVTILWHNGGTGGYVSFIGFDRAQQTGVVLLSNYGDAVTGNDALDQMGIKLLGLAARISLH